MSELERKSREENEVRDTNEKERGMEWNKSNQIKSFISFFFEKTKRIYIRTRPMI